MVTIEIRRTQHINVSVYRSRWETVLRYGQAYGKGVKQAASDLSFGKVVMIQTLSKDRYGLTLVDVLLPNGANINHILVKNGWC